MGPPGGKYPSWRAEANGSDGALEQLSHSWAESVGGCLDPPETARSLRRPGQYSRCRSVAREISNRLVDLLDRRDLFFGRTRDGFDLGGDRFGLFEEVVCRSVDLTEQAGGPLDQLERFRPFLEFHVGLES